MLKKKKRFNDGKGEDKKLQERDKRESTKRAKNIESKGVQG